MDAASTPGAEHLKELERLYNAAGSHSERDILLKGLRIVSPQEADQLQEVILRTQIREMPIQNLLQLIADQKNVSTQQADILLRDLAFEKLLDRTQLKIAAEPSARQATKTPAPPTVPAAPPAVASVPSRGPRVLVGRTVPDVRIHEDPDRTPPPATPLPAEHERNPLEYDQTENTGHHDITMMPRGMGA